MDGTPDREIETQRTIFVPFACENLKVPDPLVRPLGWKITDDGPLIVTALKAA